MLVKLLEAYPIDKLLQVTVLILMLNCIKNVCNSSPESCLKDLRAIFCVDFLINEWNIIPFTTIAHEHPSLQY